jgi:hypothetical protein
MGGRKMSGCKHIVSKRGWSKAAAHAAARFGERHRVYRRNGPRS